METGCKIANNSSKHVPLRLLFGYNKKDWNEVDVEAETY